MLRANTRSKKKKSRRSNWRTREDEKKWKGEEIRKGGVDLKTKGKRCSRASRRKSTSDERSRWKFFSSRELLFAEFPLFFFPSLFSLFFPSFQLHSPMRERPSHDDAIKRKLATLVYGGSARGIGLGVLCTGSGFTRFQLRIFNGATTVSGRNMTRKLSRKENVPPRGN